MCHTDKLQRRKTLISHLLALYLGLLLTAGAAAQWQGPQHGSRGYGGPQGMMGGGGYGTMGGGWGSESARQVTLSEATRLLEQSARSARVDRTRKEVIFAGHRVFVAMAAVQPGYPDTTFEVAGLVDPTIVVPAGSTVTLTLINMDYGPDMDHGVVVTDLPPPYPVLSMMGMPDSLTGIPILPPRDLEDAHAARYPADSVTFTAPASGDYYYLCQYYDHASKGMYGRFIVTGR